MTQMTAKDIMSQNVITVSDHNSISQLVNTLYSAVITGAPVIDSQNQLVGVISVSDVARHTAGLKSNTLSNENKIRISDFHLSAWGTPEKLEGYSIRDDDPTLVKDIMSTEVVTVDEKCPAQDIAKMMVDQRIHRVIVTKTRKIVGIVTTIDILNVFASLELTQ